MRAVSAALFLLSGLFVFSLSARNPFNALRGVGDVYILLNRGLGVEGHLVASDLYESLTANNSESSKYILSLDEARKLIRNELGSYFDFIGFNYQVSAAFSEDGAMLIAVNPGILVPFGSYIFRRAGFEDVLSSAPGILRKEDLLFMSKSGFWLLGNSAGIEKHNRRGEKEKEKKKLWNKLINEIDEDKPLNLILFSNGVTRISEKVLGKQFTAVLDDWTALSAWEGMAVDVDVGKVELSIKMTIFPAESPLTDILPMLGKENNLTKWITARTVEGGIISIPKPGGFWRRVKDAYSDRPTPREFLRNLDGELQRELGVEIAELAGNLNKELAFVNLHIDGKNRTILLAGAGKELKEYLKNKENDIPGEWRSVFKVVEIRYMKRLLSYTIMNDELIVASEPDILSAYLEELKMGKDKTRPFTRILDKQKSDSIGFVGELGRRSGDAPDKSEIGKIYYGAGVKKEGKKVAGEITLIGAFGEPTHPSFTCRIWIFTSQLLSSVFILGMVYAICVIAFNVTIIRRFGSLMVL